MLDAGETLLRHDDGPPAPVGGIVNCSNASLPYLDGEGCELVCDASLGATKTADFLCQNGTWTTPICATGVPIVSTLRLADENNVTADPLGVPRQIAANGTFLFVVDSLKHVLLRVNLSTGVFVVAAGRSGEFGKEDGSPGLFQAPAGVALAGDYLCVADTGNHLIRAVRGVATLNAEVATIAGSVRTASSCELLFKRNGFPESVSADSGFHADNVEK